MSNPSTIAVWIVLLVASQGAFVQPAWDLPGSSEPSVGPAGEVGVGLQSAIDLPLEVTPPKPFEVDGGDALTPDGAPGTRGASLADRSPFLAPPGPLLVLRYSRYDQSDPLEHPNRRRLLEGISETPGISMSKLARQSAVPLSTVRYHTRVLIEEDLARTVMLDGRRRLFPLDHARDASAAALADDPTRSVYDAVTEHEPTSISALARTLDRAPSTVSHHVDRLEGAGLVSRERQGPEVHVSTTVAAPNVGTG